MLVRRNDDGTFTATCDAGDVRHDVLRDHAVVAMTVPREFGQIGQDWTPEGRADFERAFGAALLKGIAEAEVPSLDTLARDVWAWSSGQFPESTPASTAEHLRREADELVARPTDGEEMADLFFLLVHAAGRAGIDLRRTVQAKLQKNLKRTWGPPDAQGVQEHVR